MLPTETYTNERLDHLGIVAGVCQEIGLASYLDTRAGNGPQQVSIGTATVAMILNGLGFSNRRLYLVPQYFANKPVEHLLGPGITAEMLNDDCLGRALDWLYENDPTTLFAGIALQARKVFGIQTRQVHVDTTSFSVSGDYTGAKEAGELDVTTIAITYGYSRDHRADLKQWMLAEASTHEGDVPLFLRPLDGNSSDKTTLVAAVEALQEQLSKADEEPSLYVADSSVYSEANMRRFQAAGIKWVSRVPETLAQAKALLEQDVDTWQTTADQQIHWVSRQMTLPQGTERWVLVRTTAGEQRAKETVQRQVKRTQQNWEQRLWHLGNQRFACEADARAALQREVKTLPAWFDLESSVVAHPHYEMRGRPRKEAPPVDYKWQITAIVQVNHERVAQEVRRRACFIVATHVLDSAELSDEELVTTYKEQGSVERGFRFLKDPLFLASSVFLKKPERILALSLIMVLCLLVYRLAEHRLRTRLAETGQTVPNQINKPTSTLTMHWIFQCFEGIELLHVHAATHTTSIVLRLQPLHVQVLALLGPPYQHIYNAPLSG